MKNLEGTIFMYQTYGTNKFENFNRENLHDIMCLSVVTASGNMHVYYPREGKMYKYSHGDTYRSKEEREKDFRFLLKPKDYYSLQKKLKRLYGVKKYNIVKRLSQ